MHTPEDNTNPTEEEVAEAIEKADVEASEAAPKEKLGVGGILKALSKAVNNDQMSSAQARQIRNDLGIMQSYFTQSQQNVSVKRAKRLAAKKARKVNGRKGFKGQKMTKGKR